MAPAAGAPRADQPAGAIGLLAAVVLLLSYWNYRVAGTTSVTTMVALALLVSIYLLYGNLASRWLARFGIEQAASFCFQFLVGFFVANTVLFIAAIFSPLSVAGNVAVLAGLGIAGQLLTILKGQGLAVRLRTGWPEIICVAVSGIGATLWCDDSLSPATSGGGVTVFPFWEDVFFHVRQISVFAHANGFWTMFDAQMAGARPQLYHYAIYQSPAALSLIGHTGAYEAYSGFALPFGIMLTGLAAFTLMASIWGPWPGVAATFAVVLYPDAYFQGFGNKFIGMHFVNHVAVGGLYGVALAALAWLFMLHGCRNGRYGPVILALLLMPVCLVYKAQIAVANSFLIMVFPFIFFTALRARWRIPLALLFITVFVSVVGMTQGLPGIPTLRLDGSGASDYSQLLFRHTEPGMFKDLFQWIIEKPRFKAVLGMNVAAMILLSTFGVWLTLCGVGLWLLRTSKPRSAVWFPVLVVVNYIVMSLGLALEKNGNGMAEEFLHRPLVWATFVVSAWSAGAVYFAFFGNQVPRSWGPRALLGLLALLGFLSPMAFSQNLQTLPVWSWFRTYRDLSSVPTCMVSLAHHIRDHSQANEIVQDSEGDTKMSLTGLSERQAYMIYDPKDIDGKGSLRIPKGAIDRRRELADLVAMGSAEQVNEFASQHQISWFVLRPETKVAWPDQLLGTSVLACEGYRLYRFGVDTARHS